MLKKLMLTGVSGFIGSYVASLFKQNNWSVIGVDRRQIDDKLECNLDGIYLINLPDSKFNKILKEYTPDVLIHCAGTASVELSIKDPYNDFVDSTLLTFHILNSLRLYSPTSKFILLSSAAVYGDPQSLPIKENQMLNPISPYGFHKLQCESICQEFTKSYNLSTAIVRMFSAYGPGLRRQVIWDMFNKILLNKTFILQGSGYESRDFIYVTDIAKALMLITDKSLMNGEVYNLGSGEEITIKHLASLVLKSLNYNSKPNFDGIVPSGKPLNWLADITNLQQIGFKPSVSIEEGISLVASWCKEELAK